MYIDVIIPTMWYVKNFDLVLTSYVLNPKINKIILIDNNVSKRPKYDILKDSKIELVCFNKNIYVNPAWNEGYRRSTSKIIAIINDDIKVDSSVFDMVHNFNLKKGDLIGVNLTGRKNNFIIDDFIPTEESIVKLEFNNTQPIGGQAWAFGICMFMLRESYNIIPDLYQLWYGDDYYAQNSKNVYVIKSNKIKGLISETLGHLDFDDPESDIAKRVKLDSENLLKNNHFKNCANWDLPIQTIRKYENIKVDFFENEYLKAKNTPSDINENVHILYDLCKDCKTVVEMGVRTGVSTRAFLNANVDLISFDVFLDRTVQRLFDKARSRGKNVQYIKDDVLNIEIEETDFLFIDTIHNYDQLRKELKLHGNKAQKYIAFHDTYTYGLRGENVLGFDSKGLLTAIIEFLIENPHWKFKIFKTNNNGLTVLERYK